MKWWGGCHYGTGLHTGCHYGTGAWGLHAGCHYGTGLHTGLGMSLWFGPHANQKLL